MTSLTLEGATLGQRHRSLNQLTNDTVQKKTPFSEIQNLPELSDVDRLYKIDVAAKYRNLDYILHNLKSDDSLYMSRALNKSTWLFTDPLYAEFISPDYLERELFPSMTSKAIAKTLLFVRLHLKDEALAELFYKYFDEKESKKEALKWLPKCSVKFIENKVPSEIENIDVDLFKRLCERSFKVFEIFVKKSNDYTLRHYMPSAVFLLNTHTEQFLEVFEKMEDYYRPSFHKHSTAVILSKCQDRVDEKIDIYIKKIDLATFAKHIGKDKIKDTIIKLAKQKKLGRWFSYSNLKPLVQKLPKEGKFEFIKSVFVDKNEFEDNKLQMMYCSSDIQVCSLRSAPMKRSARAGKSVNLSSVYQWYRMAPFGTAFNDLKKFIRTESSPDERISMLKILVTCAGNNPDHLYTLVQYFREKHINEPAKFKASFVSSLVETTNTYAYEERTWKILEEIYHSLDVYSDDEDSYEIWSACHSIVAYNVLHDIPIPEIILKKFMNNFTFFEKLVNKLNDSSKSKLFNFLFSELQKKMDSKSFDKKEDSDDLKTTLIQILDLLIHWKKDLADFPYVLKLVQSLANNQSYFKDEKECKSDIYNREKKWRRNLFNESLMLVQNEAVFMNALKHKPELILEQQASLDKIIKSNSFDLVRILSKLRIYFPESIAADWLKMYELKLKACRTENVGTKAVARGLCILMERERFTQLLQAYAPENYKIQWSEEDATLINLRKFLAQQMYLVRPTLHVETVLLFAKEDYLQYVLPSLSSVCHRKSKDECRKFLPTLLGGAVSLQKHGIRLAFEKLDSKELNKTFTEIWSVTKNASIRAVIFNLAFAHLCREKNSARFQELWMILKPLMQNFSSEENRTVYATLTKVEKVPKSIRAEFCMMSYNILKNLPAKLNCDSLANGLLRDIAAVMDTIDEEFVMKILLKHVNETYIQKKILQEGATSYEYNNDIDKLVASFLICSSSEEVQSKRYAQIFKAIAEHSLKMWKEVCKGQLKVKKRFRNLISSLEKNTKELIEEKEPKFVIPVGLFRNIQKITNRLSVEENYVFLTRLKMMTALCESYLDVKSELKKDIEAEMDVDATSDSDTPKETYSKHVQKKLAPVFAERCLRILKEDLEQYSLAIIPMFKRPLRYLISSIYDESAQFAAPFLRVFTADGGNVPANLVAVLLLPREERCNDNDKEAFAEVRKQLEANENREIKLYFHSKLASEDLAQRPCGYGVR